MLNAGGRIAALRLAAARLGVVIACLALAAAPLAAAPAPAPHGTSPARSQDGRFTLSGKASKLPGRELRGGRYSLVAEASAQQESRGGAFALTTSEVSEAVAGGCPCFCGALLFTDGFESGDLTAWASSAP
jgi:hypothetical protein